MCSINLFLLSLIFIFPVNRQLCQSRSVPSSEKEGYSEFGTTDVEVGFTNDHSEGFDIYDVTNTVTQTTDEIYMERNEATSSMNTPLLKDDENATNSAVNLTLTETELSDFLPESDAENVTANINVTDEMESVPLTTALLQTETDQFGGVSRDWESHSSTDIPLLFNLNASVDYEESFSLSADVTIKGINDTVLQEGFFGNISVDSYIGTADANEIVTHFLNQSQNSVLVSAWSDVVYRNEEKEEEEEEEERKEKKSTSDILGNGIEERDPGCGIPKSGHHSRKKRVVGGIRTVYGEIPWLVSLRFRGVHPFINRSGFNHLCGANLIHPRWLLSSAHCFNANVSENANVSVTKFWYAVLGENSLGVQEETQKVVEIDKIIVHERFSYTANIKDDIALLKLSEPIKETEYIKFICLDREKVVFPGEICTAAGWGMHSFEGNGSAYPFQTTLKVLSQSQCKEKVKHLHESTHFIYTNSEQMFCADSDKGRDTCHGDSGGPLQCYRNGRWYLTGVTSAGYKCGEAPGVYARVGYFIDWINGKIREN